MQVNYEAAVFWNMNTRGKYLCFTLCTGFFFDRLASNVSLYLNMQQ